MCFFYLGSSCSDISAPATPVSRTKEFVSTNPNPLGEVKTSIPHDPLLDNLLEEVPKEAFQFQKKQKRGGTIDVWWLYDDGGKIYNKKFFVNLLTVAFFNYNRSNFITTLHNQHKT